MSLAALPAPFPTRECVSVHRQCGCFFQSTLPGPPCPFALSGVSLKILRLFRCREIDGVSWLEADMRLQCYTTEWTGYAIYGVIMCVVYVFGLPLLVSILLFRRRHALFGADAAATANLAAFGFLYEDYGPSAWLWEVEELLRKLFLSAVVVVIEKGSPLQVITPPVAVRTFRVVSLLAFAIGLQLAVSMCLPSQVTLAVLVSGWAHVLHAVYKPWGAGTYM